MYRLALLEQLQLTGARLQLNRKSILYPHSPLKYPFRQLSIRTFHTQGLNLTCLNSFEAIFRVSNSF